MSILPSGTKAVNPKGAAVIPHPLGDVTLSPSLQISGIEDHAEKTIGVLGIGALPVTVIAHQQLWPVRDKHQTRSWNHGVDYPSYQYWDVLCNRRNLWLGWLTLLTTLPGLRRRQLPPGPPEKRPRHHPTNQPWSLCIPSEGSMPVRPVGGRWRHNLSGWRKTRGGIHRGVPGTSYPQDLGAADIFASGMLLGQV